MRFAFFPMTPASGNLANEVLMAATLAAHGDQTLFVLCDGAQERCGVKVANGWADGDCPGCHAAARAVHMAALGEHGSRTGLSKFVDEATRDAAFKALANTPDERLGDFHYDGQPFGAWIEPSLKVEYYGEYWQNLPDLANTMRGWLRTCLTLYLGTEGCIRQYQPDVVVVMNGLASSERAVVEAARRHGVRVTTYEMGQRPHTIALRETTPVCQYDFGEEWQEWRPYPLSAAESHRLQEFLLRRQQANKDVSEYIYSPSATGAGASVLIELGLDPQKPVLCLFTNVTADTSMMFGPGVFRDQGEWLNASIAYAARRPELQLVIRVHPAEGTNTARRAGELIRARETARSLIADVWPELPANVRVIDPETPVSSYDLMQLARVTLVYVSTVGMEAAAMGLPVVAVGNRHYARVGFTWQVGHADGYAPLLDRLVAAPGQPPGAAELVRRYLYLFYFRGCFHLPNLWSLYDLDSKTKNLSEWLEGYKRTMAYARDPHPEQVHIRRYLRGEEPYVIPPPAWRRQDPQTAPEPAAPRAQILVIPDWQNLDRLAECLLSPASQWTFPVNLILLATGCPINEAIARLSEALGRLGPPESWPEVDLVGDDLSAQQLGQLFHDTHTVAYDSIGQAPQVLGMAQQLGIPCFDFKSATVTDDILSALPGSGQRLSLDLIYRT